ncbi:MAG TPA: HNH endonuclease family protein [Candidatus Angelobacter sp.]|nr:HNH endonuclease family protein [Candidatus Angelobacter sp.]
MAFNGIAQKIASGDVVHAADVIRALAPVYLSDDQFKPAFAEKILRTTAARNKNVARYILFQLEKRLSGSEYDVDSERYSLEHILPVNPGANWQQFTDEELEDSVYRLGNMTLLETAANRDIGNLSFSEKKPIYAASQFQITRNIADENSDWNIG